MAQILPPGVNMRSFLESQSEGSVEGVGAPFLIYLPQHPHQNLERGQPKRQKDFLKSQEPRDKVQWLQLYQLQGKQGHVHLGSELTGWPSACCGHRSSEAGCTSQSFSQSSADASKLSAALPGALTPPAKLAPSLSGPGVAAGPEGRLSRRLAPRCGSSTFKKARTREHQSLASSACHQWGLVLG